MAATASTTSAANVLSSPWRLRRMIYSAPLRLPRGLPDINRQWQCFRLQPMKQHFIRIGLSASHFVRSAAILRRLDWRLLNLVSGEMRDICGKDTLVRFNSTEALCFTMDKRTLRVKSEPLPNG